LLWAEHVDIAKRHWFRVFEFALPELLPIIMSLSDAQVKQILTKLREDEQELVKEFAGKSPEQLQVDADERLQEQFEDWLGSVSSAQKLLVHQYNRERISTLDMWLEYRHEWLRQFEIALGQRTDKTLLTERLTLLMTQPDELKSEQHKVFLRQNTEAFGTLLLAMNASLSAKQSKHFYKKLGKLIQDLTELHQEALEKEAIAVKDLST
jgi:truncated hemoglobin YjbI